MKDRDGKKTEGPEREDSHEVEERICPTRAGREKLRAAVRDRVAAMKLAPPLSLADLYSCADLVLKDTGLPGRYRDLTALCAHNEVWRPTLADIPYDRRLLLLPKCLRDAGRCKGRLDEFGLLCARCGSCVIDTLHNEAEELGYAVMVAEGSPLVMALIESGKVDAVVGVSCLSVLENVFPYMEAAAIPGVAIPLLREGCVDTDVDLDQVWDAIYLRSSNPAPRLDLDGLRREVRDCFTPSALEGTLGPVRSETEGIARDWLVRSGKRWRPFLAACVFQTMRDDARASLPLPLHKLLVAVEAFHKASLVHDDIEDDDAERYGKKTLHTEFGLPVALNVGDFLLGEGYRLIGELEVSAERKARMLQVAAAGHRTLCMGQGAELCWLRSRKPLAPHDVLAIFREKTAPAFEVALHLGALFAGADDGLVAVLHRYSEALGVAYQIRDDLTDSGLEENTGLRDPDSLGPSLLLALAWDKARGVEKERIEELWRKGSAGPGTRRELARILNGLGVVEAARALLDRYRKEAVQAVSPVDRVNLKIVLHRVVGRIFSDHLLMGCCDDHQARHAPRGGEGEESPR
jgi:geranylgeranyl diphosphate synthase, type II